MSTQQTPLTTTQESPDSLPPLGYSLDQLIKYIQRRLSGGIFTVELEVQNIADMVNDSLQLYSIWRPRIRYGSVALQTNRYSYLKGVDLGLGPVQVNFVQRSPIPQALFWGNLVDVAPLMMTGMDQYDMYLRWQKTWARVTSVEPQWVYNEVDKELLIHNPIERFHCGIVAYTTYGDTKHLDFFGADWVKNYAYQQARLMLAEVLSKYSGVVPGPIKDLQLDQGKRSEATTEIKDLKEKLFAAQISTSVQVDVIFIMLMPVGMACAALAALVHSTFTSLF